MAGAAPSKARARNAPRASDGAGQVPQSSLRPRSAEASTEEATNPVVDLLAARCMVAAYSRRLHWRRNLTLDGSHANGRAVRTARDG